MVYLKQQVFVREEGACCLGNTRYLFLLPPPPTSPQVPSLQVHVACRCPVGAPARAAPAVRRGRHAGPSPPGRPSGSPVGPFSSLRNKRAASDSLKFLVVSRPWCKGSFEQFVREI